MPKVTITLQDTTTDDDKTVCRANFKLDREGYPLNAPATPALLHASAFRVLTDLGVIDRVMPLIETKSQFDELTKYLRTIGALNEKGELNVIPAHPVQPVVPANVPTPEPVEAPPAPTKKPKVKVKG